MTAVRIRAGVLAAAFLAATAAGFWLTFTWPDRWTGCAFVPTVGFKTCFTPVTGSYPTAPPAGLVIP